MFRRRVRLYNGLPTDSKKVTHNTLNDFGNIYLPKSKIIFSYFLSTNEIYKNRFQNQNYLETINHELSKSS